MERSVIAKLKTITALSVVGNNISAGSMIVGPYPRINVDVDAQPENNVAVDDRVNDSTITVSVYSTDDAQVMTLSSVIMDALHCKSYVVWGTKEVKQSLCESISGLDNELDDDDKPIYFKELVFSVKYER